MAKYSIDLQKGTLKNESELIVGIDLGTTHSLVAFINEQQQAETVKAESGSHSLVPSIVHFTENGQIQVGEQAKEKLVTDPAHTIYSVKRLMGKSYGDIKDVERYFGYQIIDEDTESLVKIRVGDRFYTPIELSADILRALKHRAEDQLNRMVSKAVITVPAYFNDAQRQATRDAGKLAGLEVLRIVNEPTAASLAYGIGLAADAPAQKVAVYDLGGGTFDISILAIHNGIFEVLSTHGNTFLGGDDFDRAIVDHWLSKGEWNKDSLLQDKSLSQSLRLAAERAKKELSTATHFSQVVNEHTLQLDRPTFEALIQPLVEQTLKSCRRALADSGLAADDIDHVILVGGSTRVPLVKQSVSDLFGRVADDSLNPDEVVALGAAIQADVLAGNQKNVLLLDVTPLSLGIETVGGLMDTLIPRNTKVPTKVGRRYTTSVDGQANLKVAVYQGERDLIEHNRKLGEFILKGIPPMPAGLPQIEIHFYLDADGILRVKAQELRSQVAQEIVIKSQYGISEEDMARMLIDSIQHAQDDMSIRALLEARNEANTILLAADKFLRQNDTIFSAEEKTTTRALVDALRQTVAQDDKDAINKAMEELNTYTRPLAQRAMDATIATAIKGRKV